MFRKAKLWAVWLKLCAHAYHIQRWGGPDASSDCGPARTAPPSQSACRGWGAAERCAGRGPCPSPGSLPATSCFSYSDAVPTACSSSSAGGGLMVHCCEVRPPCPWCPHSRQHWQIPVTGVGRQEVTFIASVSVIRKVQENVKMFFMVRCIIVSQNDQLLDGLKHFVFIVPRGWSPQIPI